MKEKAIHLASSVDDFGTCCIRVDPHAKGMGRVEPEPASDHYSFNSLRPAFGSRSHPPLHIYQFYYMIPGVLRDARQQGSYFLMGSNNRLGHSGVYAHTETGGTVRYSEPCIVTVWYWILVGDEYAKSTHRSCLLFLSL